ncbi:MAG TPA: anhydro-N-acetylmuramic acid kinase, partial [Gemmatimonadota bacterium]|nr:anhydro-N-acetylmuramic acid kinase [Gemmatimonadota bacterium]
MKLVGLMSGTSLDGIDAALLEIGGSTASGVSAPWELLAFVTVPHAEGRRERLRAAAEDRLTTS